MKFKLIGAVMLAAVLSVPAIADDEADGKKKAKRGGNHVAAAQITKQLQSVSLTQEQTAQIKELGKVADAKMKAIRDESGLTPEIMKKRMAAQKSLKDSGKKGKEMATAVNQQAGLTESQAAAMAKIGETRTKFQKDVIAILTDEQKEQLPAQLKRAMSSEKKGKGKGKGKKKKDAA